jgi:hypothetical protein
VTPRAWKAVGIAVGAVVAVNLVLQRVDRATGTPGGPVSSSFATTPEGLAAYADLLRRAGHPIERLRVTPADGALDPASTVVVLDPDGLTGDDAERLKLFVEDGGRLVTGGSAPGSWLERLVPDAPEWDSDGVPTARPLVPAAELAGVREVRTASGGSWRDAEGTLPAMAGRGGVLLSLASVSAGRVLLLADASPLQNRLLDRADNAALGLGLAGPAGRPVVFAESVHGYGRASGFGAIPARWWWTLGGLGIAALVWMVARGRRLGPPERATRRLGPPRREYVEALGGVLARTRTPVAAGELVRAAALDRLPATGDVGAAAAHAGLAPAETRALLDGVNDAAGLLAAGQALARLERGRLAAVEAGE